MQVILLIVLQSMMEIYAYTKMAVIDLLKDKYPNFEVGLKCILTVNPYLLVCSYIKWKSDVNK